MQTIVIAVALGVAGVCGLSGLAKAFAASSPETLRAVLDAQSHPAPGSDPIEDLERTATAEFFAGRLTAAQYRRALQTIARNTEQPFRIGSGPR